MKERDMHTEETPEFGTGDDEFDPADVDTSDGVTVGEVFETLIEDAETLAVEAEIATADETLGYVPNEPEAPAPIVTEDPEPEEERLVARYVLRDADGTVLDEFDPSVPFGFELAHGQTVGLEAVEG